jgi:uncharacterized membrane protein
MELLVVLYIIVFLGIMAYQVFAYLAHEKRAMHEPTEQHEAQTAKE